MTSFDLSSASKRPPHNDLTARDGPPGHLAMPNLIDCVESKGGGETACRVKRDGLERKVGGGR